MLDWTGFALSALGLILLVLAGCLLSVTRKAQAVRLWHWTRSSIHSFSGQLGTTLSFLPLLGVLSVLVVIAAFTMRAPLPANTVTLPIEVIGYDDTVTRADGMQTQGKTVSITVDITDPSGIDSLFIKGHNLTYHWDQYDNWMEGGSDLYSTQASISEGGPEMYDTKASWRVNGGDWQYISVGRSACREPFRSYDCLEGPLAKNYLELRTDATGAGNWQSGQNTIEFRFNGIGSESSGYRILGLDVLAGETSRLGATTFEYEDPSTWTAPEGFQNTSAVDAGETLWHERNILVDNFINGESFVASCADCHARDGHDLKFYNFSNRSIVARAQHHGLTETEGKEIAAFIRSNRVDARIPSGYTLDDAGRPWNPPYQPGPGLDERPVELWAAGAGVDCVLDTGKEAGKYLFPDSGSESLLASIVAVDSDPYYDSNFGVDCSNQVSPQLTQTENPERIYHQVHADSTANLTELPVAVMWPDIFQWWPDVHPFDIHGQSTVESTSWWSTYQQVHNELPEQRSDWLDSVSDFPCSGGGLEDFDKLGNKLYLHETLGWPNTPDGNYKEEYSERQFNTIKLWEIMHGYGMEDLGNEVYKSDSCPEVLSGMEDRTWFQNQAIYEASAHKWGRPGYTNEGAFRNTEANHYWGDIWYDAAIVLTNGNRAQEGGSPFDWNYNFPHVSETGDDYPIDQAYRYFRHYLTVLQSLNSDVDLRWIEMEWWRRHHEHSPQKLFVGEAMSEVLNDISKVDHIRISQQFMRAWAEVGLTYDRSMYPVGSGQNEFPDETYTPQRIEKIGWGLDAETRANELYTMAHLAAESSAPNERALDTYARWGEMMWPNGDWEQWMLQDAQHEIPLQQGWNLMSSHLSPTNDNVADIFSGVESDLAIVQNQKGDAYDPSSSSNSLDTWDDSEGYRVYMTSDQTMTIDGTELGSPSLSLSEGWNLIPYYPSSEMDVSDAFASISDKVAIVKDQAGNSYIPARGLNEIGTMKPGHAYKVYVSSATSFSYP